MSKKNLEVTADEETAANIPENETEAGGETAAPFDFEGFAAGFGTPTDTVALYPHFDLLGELSEAQIGLADARATKDVREAARLQGEVKRLAEQVRDNRVTVHLRALGLSRISELRDEATALGITDKLQIDVYQTAQQIVAPVELADYETLRAISERAAGQVWNLMQRATALNNMVVPPSVPFS